MTNDMTLKLKAPNMQVRGVVGVFRAWLITAVH